MFSRDNLLQARMMPYRNDYTQTITSVSCTRHLLRTNTRRVRRSWCRRRLTLVWWFFSEERRHACSQARTKCCDASHLSMQIENARTLDVRMRRLVCVRLIAQVTTFINGLCYDQQTHTHADMNMGCVPIVCVSVWKIKRHPSCEMWWLLYEPANGAFSTRYLSQSWANRCFVMITGYVFCDHLNKRIRIRLNPFCPAIQMQSINRWCDFHGTLATNHIGIMLQALEQLNIRFIFI